MNKSSTKILIAGIFLSSLVFIFLSTEVLSQVSVKSANYKISRFTLNPAGNNASSTNYKLHVKISQFGTNVTSSTNYRISWGWFEVTDLPNIFITVFLNSTTPWYAESVNASGRVYEIDNDPIAGASISVSAPTSSCTTLTNADGYWSCNFTAVGELGKYQATASVAESDGTLRTDVKNFEVVLRYGDSPIGTVSRFVYEVPILIQEPSGNVRVATARITVWRSGT